MRMIGKNESYAIKEIGVNKIVCQRFIMNDL